MIFMLSWSGLISALCLSLPLPPRPQVILLRLDPVAHLRAEWSTLRLAHLANYLYHSNILLVSVLLVEAALSRLIVDDCSGWCQQQPWPARIRMDAQHTLRTLSPVDMIVVTLFPLSYPLISSQLDGQSTVWCSRWFWNESCGLSTIRTWQQRGIKIPYIVHTHL